jgi:hypothetical protein
MRNGDADRIMAFRLHGPAGGVGGPDAQLALNASPREEMLEKKLKALEKRLNDLESRLPKH